MSELKTVYCDFDGTISKEDSVYAFLSLFADKKWLDIESLWQQEKMSSKECLEKQVALLPVMEQRVFDDYVKAIEIDEYFIEFYKYLKSKNIELIILSDGFDLFIKKVLERNGLSEIKYYANSLLYEDNKFDIKFDNHNDACNIGSGSCKCSKVKEKDFYYIGDGYSDVCIAKKAQQLFAKSNLKKYCEEKNIKHIPFSTFEDILNEMRKGEINATAC